jgi:hypothetical protein
VLQDTPRVFPVLRNILCQPEDIALVPLGKFCKCISISEASLRHDAGFIESGWFWPDMILNCIIHGPGHPARPFQIQTVDSVDDSGRIKLPDCVLSPVFTFRS